MSNRSTKYILPPSLAKRLDSLSIELFTKLHSVLVNIDPENLPDHPLKEQLVEIERLFPGYTGNVHANEEGETPAPVYEFLVKNYGNRFLLGGSFNSHNYYYEVKVSTLPSGRYPNGYSYDFNSTGVSTGLSSKSSQGERLVPYYSLNINFLESLGKVLEFIVEEYPNPVSDVLLVELKGVLDEIHGLYKNHEDELNALHAEYFVLFQQLTDQKNLVLLPLFGAYEDNAGSMVSEFLDSNDPIDPGDPGDPGNPPKANEIFADLLPLLKLANRVSKRFELSGPFTFLNELMATVLTELTPERLNEFLGPVDDIVTSTSETLGQHQDESVDQINETSDSNTENANSVGDNSTTNAESLLKSLDIITKEQTENLNLQILELSKTLSGLKLPELIEAPQVFESLSEIAAGSEVIATSMISNLESIGGLVISNLGVLKSIRTEVLQTLGKIDSRISDRASELSNLDEHLKTGNKVYTFMKEELEQLKTMEKLDALISNGEKLSEEINWAVQELREGGSPSNPSPVPGLTFGKIFGSVISFLDNTAMIKSKITSLFGLLIMVGVATGVVIDPTISWNDRWAEFGLGLQLLFIEDPSFMKRFSTRIE